MGDAQIRPLRRLDDAIAYSKIPCHIDVNSPGSEPSPKTAVPLHKQRNASAIRFWGTLTRSSSPHPHWQNSSTEDWSTKIWSRIVPSAEVAGGGQLFGELIVQKALFALHSVEERADVVSYPRVNACSSLSARRMPKPCVRIGDGWLGRVRSCLRLA